MEASRSKLRRRKTPWVVGTLMVASLAILVVLQSTNLWRNLAIESSADLLLLYALSSLNFIAFVIFGFIFLRSIIKLMRERRTLELGAQIKTRLLIYFFAVSLLPIIAMAVFSYLFMNRALERWFTQIPENVIREAREVQRRSVADRYEKLVESAKMAAVAIGRSQPGPEVLERMAESGGLVHIAVLGPTGEPIASYTRDIERRSELAAVIRSIDPGGIPNPADSDGVGFDAVSVELPESKWLVVVPDPYGGRAVSQIVENSVLEFERLKEKQVMVRQVGLLTLGVLTFLLIFASSWIAFYVARGLTTPIKALAEGADEIARGNLGHRVKTLAEDELGLLVDAFNDMSAKLESNSAELNERRRYIETVLATLPTGVISIGSDGRIGTINRAAVEMFGLSGTSESEKLANIVAAPDLAGLERLIDRARRAGRASDQMVLNVLNLPGNDEPGVITAAVTAVRLPSGSEVVLVIEDLSELIAAQRSSAWQEVARRMAHEIKNPLTPIQLSAERIAKRFDNTGHRNGGSGQRIDDKGPIGDVVHESTATILREVSSLKSMVEEFSRFARLPDAQLEGSSVNEIIRNTAAAFEGRIEQSALVLDLALDLPSVLADKEQLKRAFHNLIENAIEAAPGAAAAAITISSRYETARDIVVIEIADSGKGIDKRDLPKLFQPYFSTKGRGTGLGLAIVHRIIGEHGGKIKAVSNIPTGAKFIVELPAAE